MNSTNAVDLINLAIARGEVSQLLIGEDPYVYLPPGTPSEERTDLAEVLRIAYDQLPDDRRPELRRALLDTVEKLLPRYDGLFPIAVCLLIEVLRRARNRKPLNLPTETIAARLRERICDYRTQLSGDKSGPGKYFVDGRLGDLRRLSNICAELGGESFVD